MLFYDYINVTSPARENYISPFEGNCKADVAPGENQFDTPCLE